jgi:hypothetical protein
MDNLSESIKEEIDKAYEQWLIDKHKIVDGLKELIVKAGESYATFISPGMCQEIIDFIERSRF